MSSKDYHKGQEHRYYGYGMYRSDSDYRRGYNDMEEKLQMEEYQRQEREEYEHQMEQLMIEEEMQRQMQEDEFNRFLQILCNAIDL